MAKMMSGKAKIAGMKAKSVAMFENGKDPKKVITSTKVKGAGIDLPAMGKNKTMKAKSMSKMR